MPSEIKLLHSREWEDYGLTKEQFYSISRHKRYILRHPEKVRKCRRRYYDENRDYQIKRQRKYHLAKYGLTEEQYDEMFSRQGNKCLICKSIEPRGQCSNFCVDHCHHTGEVRGILCSACNRALGLFGDDEQLLRSALDYLNNFQPCNTYKQSKEV